MTRLEWTMDAEGDLVARCGTLDEVLDAVEALEQAGLPVAAIATGGKYLVMVPTGRVSTDQFVRDPGIYLAGLRVPE